MKGHVASNIVQPLRTVELSVAVSSQKMRDTRRRGMSDHNESSESDLTFTLSLSSYDGKDAATEPTSLHK